MPKKTSSAKKEESKAGIPSAPPVFDVSKPGETAATPTSRPIIVGHKVMVKKDPMVSSEASDEDSKLAEEASAKLVHKKETTIKPINEEPQEEQKVEETAPAEEKTEEPAATEEKSEPSEDSKPEEEASKPASTGAGAIGALADEASVKRQGQKAKEEEEKKRAHIEELIKSGKYHLPVHDAAYSGSRTFSLFINTLLIVLLLATGAILAHDAGYIDLGLDLPFDLIK